MHAIIVVVVVWFFAFPILLYWGKKICLMKNYEIFLVIAGFILIEFGLYFGCNAVAIPIIRLTKLTSALEFKTKREEEDES